MKSCVLRRRVAGLVLALAAVAWGCTTAAEMPHQEDASVRVAHVGQAACAVGTYQSAVGDAVVLRHTPNGTRYLLLDGRRGSVTDPDSPVECRTDEVAVRMPGGAVETWPRLHLQQTPTRFEREGTSFFGRLIEPPGGESRPLVILGHGSENVAMASGEGAEPWPAWVNLLAAQGLSVFIFDKRGTGESGGRFTMDFHLLAHDLTAAAAEARRLAAGRHARFGLAGFSQGGWVAPLAATHMDLDFLIVGYGALYNPLEEAGEEVHYRLAERGYAPDAIAAAHRLIEAAAVVQGSGFQQGFAELERLRREYAAEAWLEVIRARGDWLGHVVRSSERELRRQTASNPLGIPWLHDGIDVLRSLSAPQLWILAEQDHIAPVRLNLERLPMLQAEGVPIQMALFPDTDHGMFEFVRRDDGTRMYTRITEGFLRLVGDWAHGELMPSYGSASLFPPLERR